MENIKEGFFYTKLQRSIPEMKYTSNLEIEYDREIERIERKKRRIRSNFFLPAIMILNDKIHSPCTTFHDERNERDLFNQDPAAELGHVTSPEN